MSFCSNCGNKLEENSKFCPHCGIEVEKAGHGQQTESTENQYTGVDITNEFDPNDITENKVITVLSYLSWLLLIPLFAAPKSKFARFHVNQGLILAIAEIIWAVASGIIIAVFTAIFSIIGFVFIGSILSAVLKLVNLAFLVFSIIGIVNVINGQAKELPIIGHFRILK